MDQRPEFSVEPLLKHHDRESFSCGVDALDQYLKKQASQDLRRRAAVPFLLLEASTKKIVGFYTLSSFAVPINLLPEKIRKKLPRYDLIPTTLIGRLAISTDFKGKGLGGVLLANALKTSYQQSLTIASFAVVVDAKDESAISFYKHYGFQTFMDCKDRLFLPMKTIKNELDI